MKNYEKNIESSYLMYLDENNLHGWAISQKLHVNGFEWVEEWFESDERFIKSYGENSDKWYFLEEDVKYPKNLFSLHRDFPFSAERKKIDTCKKLVCNMHAKKSYVIHIRALKKR